MQRAEKLVAPNAPVNWMRWKRLEQNRLSGVLLDAIPSRQWSLHGLVTPILCSVNASCNLKPGLQLNTFYAPLRDEVGRLP